MDLLLAIQNFTDKLVEYNFYPKRKKPSLGKLEKMADLCMEGKFRKLSRYIPEDTTNEIKQELNNLMDIIKEKVNETKN